jgi:hypothetical protein
MLVQYFLSMFVLVFAIAAMMIGVLSACLGLGRSRVIGILLIGLGMLVLIVFILGLNILPISVPDMLNFSGIIGNAIAAVAGALVAIVVAFFIGLFIVLKS